MKKKVITYIIGFLLIFLAAFYFGRMQDKIQQDFDSMHSLCSLESYEMKVVNKRTYKNYKKYGF